jgi:hypothetical protein
LLQQKNSTRPEMPQIRTMVADNIVVECPAATRHSGIFSAPPSLSANDAAATRVQLAKAISQKRNGIIEPCCSILCRNYAESRRNYAKLRQITPTLATIAPKYGATTQQVLDTFD